MKITKIACKFEQNLTIPVGFIHLALNTENGDAYICDMSPTEEFIHHKIEGWHFATIYNRIESRITIPAQEVIKQAEDENGNNYTYIPNYVVEL